MPSTPAPRCRKLRTEGTDNREGNPQRGSRPRAFLGGQGHEPPREDGGHEPSWQGQGVFGGDSRLPASSPQEFNSGARIFVGGQEAAMMAMGRRGGNPAGIDFCVDCRNDMGSGRGGTSESFGLYRDGARAGLRCGG